MSKKIIKRHVVPMKAHVFIGMPTPLNYQIDVEAATFCAAACARGIASWVPMPSRTAEDARNKLIQVFLTEHKPCTHLFFLDADTSPMNLYALERLLSYNKDVVCGVTPCYMKNTKKIRWSVRHEKGWYGKGDLPKGLFKADAVGGTTILLKRSVLEKLEMPYQDTIRDPKTYEVLVNEDVFFAKKLKRAGFDLWVDPEIKCRHRNSLDLLEFMDDA